MDDVLAFVGEVARLKRVRRAGWVRCGVGEAESVADHSFGVALLAMMLSKGRGVDRQRCVMMALLHDAAEAVIGDITPRDGISAEEKHRRESEAMGRLAGALGDGEVMALWEEFEAGMTEEARLVRDLDLIEMAMQAMEYERSGELSGAAAEGFLDSARQRVGTEAGREVMERIVGGRWER